MERGHAMGYGICSWVFGEATLGRVASDVAALGYKGLELFGDWNRYPEKDVRQTLAAAGLRVFSLTPGDVDPAAPESDIRAEAVDYYLRLIDYATEIGAPIVSCHGRVGRVRAATSQEEEEALLLESVQLIAEHAEAAGVLIAMEVLNRYETHLINTAAQARRFVERISSPAVGILLDTYHMNIEEADPIAAVVGTRDRLVLFHVADSNRLGVGRGHIPFAGLLGTLNRISYDGPVVAECTAPGPDPFTPVKGPDSYKQALDEARTSIARLRALETA